MKPEPRSTARVTTEHFSFQRIDGTPLLEDSFALRFQVYCLERPFLPPSDYPTGKESDRYDAHSLHFAAFDTKNQMVGTVRLVCANDGDFPMLAHCQVDSLLFPSNIENNQIAEISRLAVSKLYRRRTDDGVYGLTGGDRVDPLGRRQKPEIVFGLYKIMYQESKRQGIRFWYAAMESSLDRLLARYAFEFSPVGPETDYYGPVTPFVADIGQIERQVHAQRPDIFREFTDGMDPALLQNDLRHATIQMASTGG